MLKYDSGLAHARRRRVYTSCGQLLAGRLSQRASNVLKIGTSNVLEHELGVIFCTFEKSFYLQSIYDKDSSKEKFYKIIFLYQLLFLTLLSHKKS